MTTNQELRTALRQIDVGARNGRFNSPTADLLAIIEGQQLTTPAELTQAVEEATTAIANIRAVQNVETDNIANLAADPAKLAKHLDKVAQANALQGVVLSNIYTELQGKTLRASYRAAHTVLGEFIDRNKDNPAYTQTGATPGERLMAQERRDPINAVHGKLIRIAAGGERPPHTVDYWLRWTWTAEQWVRIPQRFPGWEVPSIDEAAIELGATHRFARSLSQAVEESERCLKEVEKDEELAEML